MRIAIAGQTYYPAANGQAVFTVNLAEGLARAGHTVMMIIPSDRMRSYRTTRRGVRIEAIAAIPLNFLHTDAYFTPLPGIQVGQLLEEFRPEIVHVQDHYPLCRSVVKAARRLQLPVMGTNHFLPENVTHYLPMPSWGQEDLSRLMWTAMLALFNRLDMATTPTETAANILREQAITVPVHAVSCGVDLARFFPDPHVDRALLRRRYGLDPNRKLFLFVGRVDQEKKLDVMLRALALVEREDVQFAIAGQGEDRDYLESLAAELSLGNRVAFAGYIPADDLPSLLNSADFFAMPSEAELQSIATLEAMACGLPVLAANARALPELVDHDVNGYLFQAGNPRDAARTIERLLNEPNRQAEMGLASLAKAQSHSVGNTCKRYEELYRQMAGARLAPWPSPKSDAYRRVSSPPY